MKPYSRDLRERVIEAYARGEGTQKGLAKRFAVSLSSVARWLRDYRAKGSVAPKPNLGGTWLRIVTEKDKDQLIQWYKEQPDATYEEMAERFSKETGRYIARSTMGKAVLRLGITRKKRRFAPPNATQKK
jgi:transposase